MNKPIRPNFFLVGSMKSGTTSLHRYLKSHPDIFMTEDPKEPTYFLDLEQLRDVLPGLEKRRIWASEQNYLSLFSDAGSCRIVGEASANYARLNRVQHVPERVSKFNPAAQILFIGRDPVERTISHYWYMVRFFGETRPMLEAVQSEDDYIDTSNYRLQLDSWYSAFPPEQIKFITTEALRDNSVQTMSEVFSWLGVDPGFVPPNLDERANIKPKVVSQVRGAGWLHKFRHSRFWSAIGPHIPAGFRKIGRNLSEKPVDTTVVDRAAVLAYLRPIQRPQVDALADLLGREFPEWRTLYADDE